MLALILFTGCRKNEVLRLRWRDVDFAGAELRLPDTKKGKPDVVPLVPEAIEVLRALPRGIGEAPVFRHIHTSALGRGFARGSGWRCTRTWRPSCACWPSRT
jgi:integrase